jgi:hypothetical protein
MVSQGGTRQSATDRMDTGGNSQPEGAAQGSSCHSSPAKASHGPRPAHVAGRISIRREGLSSAALDGLTASSRGDGAESVSQQPQQQEHPVWVPMPAQPQAACCRRFVSVPPPLAFMTCCFAGTTAMPVDASIVAAIWTQIRKVFATRRTVRIPPKPLAFFKVA